MATNPLTCGNISVGGISAGSLNTNYLSTGTMTLGNVFASSLVVSNITTGAVAYYVGINAGVNPLTAGNLTVGTVVCSTLNMSTNPLTAGNISAGAIVTGPIYAAPGAYSLIAGSASLGTIIASSGNLNRVTCGAISVGQILASTIGINTSNPQYTIDVNGTINAKNYYLNGSLVPTAPPLVYDGSTSAKAAPSAKYIQQNFAQYTDGVYWINLPTVGPTQILCLMQAVWAGGGWMMAMKGTRGSTFQYGSSYWTTINTLNPSDTNRNDGDSKFHTFNYFPATDWMAIFPDVTSGGDIPTSYLNVGWTWVENNAVNDTIPLVTWFALGNQYTKLSNGISTYSNGAPFYATNPIPLNSTKYYSNSNNTVLNQTVSPVWSYEVGFQWYGFNYGSSNNIGNNVRWGFAWNDQTDQLSNDYRAGIGMNNGWSAGDYGNVTNRTMRFEWYVR
jgi:hypothetical protein